MANRANNSEKSVRTIIALLHKWGIHTFGDFTRLDKEEIRNRLGSGAVRLWERAHGKTTRLLKLVEPPESFIETFEFEYEIETAEPLLFVLRRFLEQLSRRLTGIYLVAKTVTLRLEFSNKQGYERRFEIPEPTNSVELLFRMLQTHLEDFKSEHPIVAVSLEAEAAKPLPHQFGLFEATLRNPNQLYETLARLTAFLGADRVGTPVLEETHRPDAFRLEPFAWELPAAAASKPAPTSGPALRRFRPARPAAVLLEATQPVHLRSPDLQGSIVDKAGPYMGSGDWWDQKAWTRREWDAELPNGSICRLYWNGETWELDGVYD
jgi:impB/mucB/samB family protein